MDIVEKRVLVDVPVPAVSHFVNEPFNLLRICPTIVEISEVERLKHGGRNFHCVSKMADVRIQYVCECTEYVPDHRISYKISGGLHGAAQWRFEPQAEQTLVSLVFEYEPPPPLLKHHAQSDIRQRNEHDAQQILSNLKLLLEKQVLVQD
jgi:hypothetical protein